MVYPLADIQEDLERELDALYQLRFTHDELDYLRSLRFIKSDFVDYLELFNSNATSSKSVKTIKAV